MPNIPNINLKDTFVVGLPFSSLKRKEIDDVLVGDNKKLHEERYRRQMLIANQLDSETTEPQDMSQNLDASLADVQSKIEKFNASLDEMNAELEETYHSSNDTRDMEKLSGIGKDIGLYNNIIRSVMNGSYDNSSRAVLMNELQNCDALLSSICLNISSIIDEVIVHKNENYDEENKKYIHFRDLTLVKLFTYLATYTLMHDNLKSQKLELITYNKIKEYLPVLVKREIRTQDGLEQVEEAFTRVLPKDRLDNPVNQRINQIEAETGYPLSREEKEKIMKMYSTKNIFVPFVDKKMLEDLKTYGEEQYAPINDEQAGRMGNIPNQGEFIPPPPPTPPPEEDDDWDLGDLLGHGKKRKPKAKASKKSHFSVKTNTLTHIPEAFDQHPFY
jgi:hypothetical protein